MRGTSAKVVVASVYERLNQGAIRVTRALKHVPWWEKVDARVADLTALKQLHFLIDEPPNYSLIPLPAIRNRFPMLEA
jgi:hypothetical protein